jgi:membrane protease YdiL (CAAX protease family)
VARIQGPEDARMETKPIGIRILALSTGAILFIEIALWLVVGGKSMVTLGLARIVEGILILSLASIFGEGWSSIGLERSRLGFGFKKGLIWSAGFGVVAAVALTVLLFLGIQALALLKVTLPKGTLELALFFVVGGIIAPVAEEIFFRGILYGFFRRWGVAVAVILSTCLFVLPHMRAHAVPLTQAVGGLVFAVAYEVEGSLVVPITIHVLGNLALFTLSLLI